MRTSSRLRSVPLRTPTVSAQSNRKTLPARELGRGGVFGPALLAECVKSSPAAASLEGSEGRKRAPRRAGEHSAPDGAAAPRAGTIASKDKGRGATGSARLTSLQSRISSLLACSRAGAELQPEPDCELPASERKSKEGPWWL